MNKSSLILKYFQKADQLTIRNQPYCSTFSSLFLWLMENDKAAGDVTSKMLNLQGQAKAVIIGKQEGIVAGLEEIAFLLQKHTSLFFKPLTTDGKAIRKNQIIAELKGDAFEILAYERTVLNILQRMSGIATETSRLVHLIKDNLKLKTYNLKSFIAATRKTPWMQLDKKAVAIGGGLTHRLDLSDGILIKDNHLKAIKEQYKLETEKKAIEKALEISFRRLNLAKRGSTSIDSIELIEIEVTTPNQAHLTLQTWNRLQTHNSQLTTHNYLAIMFDNFSPDQVKAILTNLSDLERNQIIFEASGGITEENISEWAKTGVDIISIGALTHSPKAINLSLEI